ncbi:hypothetical protein FHG64_04510 [Antarcticibacterium flavum]|uniref:DUF4968 domain-containing protein n=1 Tax=Antarcticibacterium flavum TaxID=2058175 RepID=A0A5B7X0F4_9FLAO|nr:hypothetical protein FHG64_04510 [Antarcticibacterium flavum]
MIFLAIFFMGLNLKAQDSIRPNIEENRDSVIIASKEGVFSLSFSGKDKLETSFSNSSSSDSLVVHMGKGEQDLKLNVPEVADSLSISSEGIDIFINKDPFGITYNFDQLWVDLQTGKRHLPGSSILVSGEEDIVPELARSGAIFTVIKEEKYGEPLRYLQLHYIFSSATEEKQRNTCDDSIITGDHCFHIEVKSTNSLDITIERQPAPFREAGEGLDSDDVDFVVHIINRTVKFVWVNGIKYTGKNYMHQGNLVVPLSFRDDKVELKVEWN